VNPVSVLSNIVRRTLDHRYRGEVIRKARYRLRDRLERADRESSEAWCHSHAEDPAVWAKAIDPDAWTHATAYAAGHVAHARNLLTGAASGLGGGGFPALLYFLVRLRRPTRVVETGVAAGHSSRAILRALAANQHGHLWSSDLPYFTMNDAETLIGVLVESPLKSRWTLMTEGDRRCLPDIVSEAAPIDMLHYDSDKSREGRSFAWSVVAPHLAPDALVIFDDIQDNGHFRDLTRTADDFHVFAFARKWVGLIDMRTAGALTS
jgi:predicted O-methyltransferase YrrM